MMLKEVTEVTDIRTRGRDHGRITEGRLGEMRRQLGQQAENLEHILLKTSRACPPVYVTRKGPLSNNKLVLCTF
jgi:hypothetical protein